jgi:hypothetical protein
MLRESGVIAAGQVPVAQDIQDSFNRTNTMLAQWQRKRWLVYHLIDVVCNSTGVPNYSVGPGQQFNIANRPERIYSAFFRQFPGGAIPQVSFQVRVRDHYNPNIISNIVPLTIAGVAGPQPNIVDYPLNVIRTWENYSVIALKTLPSWPESVFLDTGWPFGTAKFYPVPLAGQFELHLQFSEVLQRFVNLSDEINLPPEYEGGMLYNLICRTRAAYGLAADPVMIALAKDGLDVIREANLQIPNMSMPPTLIRDGRYNIYSDNTDR